MPHKDPEVKRAYFRNYQEAHRERRQDTNRASYERHKEQIQERRRKRAESIPLEERRAKGREYSARYRAKQGVKPRTKRVLESKPARTPLSLEERLQHRRDSSKRYYYAHPDKRRMTWSKYYHANRERLRMYDRLRNVKRRAAMRAWHVNNRDLRREQAKIRNMKNPEKRRNYAMARHARILQTIVLPIDTEAIIARSEGRCVICKRKVPVAERSFDHILPLSRGGTHTTANLRLTHRLCNAIRGNRGSAQLLLIL